MIFLQLSEQLQLLINLLVSISDEQYKQEVTHLCNATIGGHTRHIIELLECAQNGYITGKVDYINRKRDLNLEVDKEFAIRKLNDLMESFDMADKSLFLITDCADNTLVSTTFHREIVYNTEHAIHHLAIIKVALIEMKISYNPTEFGMAYSTIKYKATLQQ